MKKKFLILVFVVVLIFLVIDPANNIDSFFSGIRVWATAVLPALFPFFFFTKFLAELGFPEAVGKYLSPITKKLYNTSGISGYIFVMSILSGYPVGAKLNADMFEKEIITKNEATRIMAYTSTSGPLFIIGTIGIGLYKSQLLGILILIAHILGALINGLIYRNIGKEEKLKNNNIQISKVFSNKNILEECMFNSIKSILIIGGYVAIFFLLISILNTYKVFTPIIFLVKSIFPNMNIDVVQSLLNGIVEITRGCLDLSKSTINSKTLLIVSSFMIGFGGFSVHFQAFTFLKKIGISFKLYLLTKTTQSIISIIIAYILGILFL